MKPKKSPSHSSLTATLKALLATGAMALGASNASAASSTPASPAPANDLQSRLERVRQEIQDRMPLDPALEPSDGTETVPSKMGRFWRNWGNGGWRAPRRAWGNGWPNWNNWNNWRNGGPSFWANF
jgi:rSAM-associated Gly-rich repeat protein